jgi:hypothetical protein
MWGLGMTLSLAACGDANTTISSNNSIEAQRSATTAPEASVGSATEVAQDKWLTFTSETDGFSVDMPGEPQISTQSMDSALGELIFHFFQLTKGTAHYAVSYNDYPVEMTAEDLDADSILNDALGAVAQSSKAGNVQRIDMQGHPGIEGEVSLKGGMHVWYRGVLVYNRLYQLIVAVPEGGKDVFADDAGRFIRSFTILPR